MSILNQALGGKIRDPEGVILQPSRSQNPFPVRRAREEEGVADFHGFSYAPSEQARAAFNTDTTYTAPAEGSELFTEGSTTYGVPGNFNRLANTDLTVLTDMAKFVNDGQNGDPAGSTLASRPYGNLKMSHSFSTGRGSRNDTIGRATPAANGQPSGTQYVSGQGWGVSLSVDGRDTNSNQYSLERMGITDLNSNDLPETITVANDTSTDGETTNVRGSESLTDDERSALDGG